MTVTPSSSESSAVEQPELESTAIEQAENLLDVEQSLDAMAQDMADDIPEEALKCLTSKGVPWLASTTKYHGEQASYNWLTGIDPWQECKCKARWKGRFHFGKTSQGS